MIVPTGFPVIDPDGTDPHASSTTPQLLVIQEQAKSEPVDTALRQANRAPTADQVATGHLHEPTTEKLSIMSAKFPLRKQFAKPTSHVLTNYFEVSWNNNTKFFVYEITDIPAGNKRKTKAVVKTAIQAWDFLRNNQIHFATDHLKFVVAWRDLHTGIQCPRKSTPADEVMWTPTPIADGDRRVQLYFKYHGEMNLDRLQDYVNPRSKPNDSALPDFNFNPLVAYLNTVIAKNLTDEVFQTSSHKFFFKDSHEVLGRSKSLCVMRGYDYTISPAMEKVLLNVNAATSAFYRPITVAEFLKDNTFHQNERERRIKRLRVYITPERLAVTDPEEQIRVDNLNRPQNRIKTVKAFGGDIGNRSDDALKFRKWFNNGGQLQQANEDTHVVDHMKSVFGHAHRFDENLKAVNVGSDDEPVWYPQEFLRILPYQLYNNLLPDTLIDSMLTLACQTPDHVRARIEAEGLKGLGIIQKDGAQKFDKCDALTIDPRMLQIPSTRMEQVHAVYAKESGKPEYKKPNMDGKAQWNLDGNFNFFKTPTSGSSLEYYMINGSDLTEEKIAETYKQAMNASITQYGIAKDAICCGISTLPSYRKTTKKEESDETVSETHEELKKPDITLAKTHEELKKDIKEAIERCQQQSANGKLVILLLERYNIPVYSAFKDVADRIAGLQSLCVTAEKNSNKQLGDKGLSQYFANVMMKVNLKQGGLNHTACDENPGEGTIRNSLFKKAPARSVMILGADVTHPGPNSLVGCPSIAALVGSVDLDGGKFLGSMRLQEKSKKEMIDDIEGMAEDRFRAWLVAQKSFPDVLYYRDGVSTGQYEQVVKEELQAIKKAWNKVFRGEPAGSPKMTAVVAVKRHNTRFFPMAGEAHANGNCKAGTLVDSGITSPFFSEFYLQSHHALQGTAIPTKYFVLENGLKFSDTEIQRLTHKLCFTYVRATMGVSYAPPAYYADRLCERGRNYLRDWFTPNYESDHFKAYQNRKVTIDDDAKTALRNTISRLPVQPIPAGRRRARKSVEQVEEERKSRKGAEDLLESEYLIAAKQYFQGQRNDGPGPWAEALDKTMFWM
ncbi:hypothetical protein J4E83_001272 [Alternaria metachromatica]|uniref:uncharacterized protein n=1 Tax=Alternaria metachromatica TaxID=283354 RepID=UPI0020C23DA4|nr:uncharacterized protein J4E83_001272 [Alternaria metachromatica]KAI4636318.1 hypothetical protein J4E83_001272 [Alternaria metachromatica]